MDEHPRGYRILRKGEIHRFPAPPPQPKRADPERDEIIRRIRAAQIREYLKRRRAS